MVSGFSYRSFKEYLKTPLERSELQFMKRTFSFASIYFFLFGILVTILHFICSSFSNSWTFVAVCSAIGLCTCFPLSFFAIKYRNNPLRVPNSFVQSCFVLLTLSFAVLFLAVMRILSLTTSFGKDNTSFVGLIAAIFGSSFAIYLIPASIGLFISKRKIICSLNRMVSVCCGLYLLCFVVYMIFSVAVYQFTSSLSVFMMILMFFILICSPILTFYRLKTVAYYINYEDIDERRRWENYFVFEIAYQMLNLALWVMRIACRLLARSSSCCRL